MELPKLCMRGQGQWRLLQFRNRCLQALLVILWIDYLPLVVRIFRLFHCTEVSPRPCAGSQVAAAHPHGLVRTGG